MPEGQTGHLLHARCVAAGRRVEPAPRVAKRAGYEVLFMTDPVDEWVVRGLREFEGKPLQSAMDEKLDLGTQPGEEAGKEKAAPDATTEKLLARVRDVLSEQVSEVRLSDRLTDSPSCLVVPEGGLGPYIERLLRMQQGSDMPSQKRILELNAKHPLVSGLTQLHQRDEKSDAVTETIELLYDQALLSEGSPIDDPARVARRLTRLMTSSTEALLSGSST